MRLSVKARYGLAALVAMAESRDGRHVTLSALSQRLGVSKIYLEQVFLLLKRGGVVTAAKGAHGGYALARPAEQITALDVLAAIEAHLFEPAEPAVPDGQDPIAAALRQAVFTPMDEALAKTLSAATIAAIAERTISQDFMFYL